jgi:hypothetical protein
MMQWQEFFCFLIMNLAGWEKLGGRYIMCNQSDLGCDCANPHDTRYYPERLLVFDKHPGGIGIAAQVRLLKMY